MGRLIDADNIKGYAKYIKTNEKFEPYIMIDDLSKLLDEQPTAYSVANVVEELEIELEKGNIAIDLGEFRLFEIVKQGSVSDDVCEWRFEETNGIAWHCDDKCTTYNQVYIKDLKITLEDFECKCPYCGKKIKVVD